MGKVSILNSEQKIVLSALAKQKIVISDYYFTGGTALSEIYLHHRDSVDLDFFSLKPVDQPKITEMLKSCFDALGVTLEMQFVDPVLMCYLSFPHGKKLKVDFAQYPYPQLELSKKHIGNLKVDSLIDIAINKMQTITQRQEVKDFVDLYFLL
ncbi:MAG: nucleotidyl transferase AbiEii/AbiGii toxin family protein, partial [Patescibacteria group bacterium]